MSRAMPTPSRAGSGMPVVSTSENTPSRAKT
jgi:hypothetical protein